MTTEPYTRIQTYRNIYFMLLGLLALSVVTAYLELGPLNVVLNVGIALVKATLIVLFFMHVRYGNGLVQLLAGVGLLWVLLLFGLTGLDYLTRQPF